VDHALELPDSNPSLKIRSGTTFDHLKGDVHVGLGGGACCARGDIPGPLHGHTEGRRVLAVEKAHHRGSGYGTVLDQADVSPNRKLDEKITEESPMQ